MKNSQINRIWYWKEFDRFWKKKRRKKIFYKLKKLKN